MKAAPLSRERLARAALALIDAEGLEALSMRRLGAALGVEGMAIYHYFPGKEDLLDAVVERLVAEIELPDEAGLDWIDWLRRTAHSYRAIARRHPNAFPLLAVRRYATEATFQHLERLFGALRAGGLDPAMTARAFRSIGYFINGAGLADIASTAATRLDALADPDLPNVTAVAPHLRPAKLDAIFAFGLETLLEGLRRSAAEKPLRASRNRPRASAGRR